MSKTIKSSRGLLVFGLFWTAFSSIFLVVGLKTGYDALNRSTWPEAPCTVTSFQIKASQKTDPPFQPNIEYTYQWENISYTGYQLWADKKGEDDYEDLADIIERQRSNGFTTCHVNPLITP